MNKPPRNIRIAWAEHHRGFGWSNWLIHYIEVVGNELVEQVIQPEDQTAEMGALFEVGVASSKSLTGAVEKKFRLENGDTFITDINTRWGGGYVI